MDKLLSSRSIDISALREAPALAFEQAGDEAVVVLNHNRPAGYTGWLAPTGSTRNVALHEL